MRGPCSSKEITDTEAGLISMRWKRSSAMPAKCATAGGEDDDTAVAISRQRSAELPAVHARHHQVEHHQLRLELVDGAQGGAAVPGGAHVEALVPQAEGDEVGDALLVVDHEHSGGLAHRPSIGSVLPNPDPA